MGEILKALAYIKKNHTPKMHYAWLWFNVYEILEKKRMQWQNVDCWLLRSGFRKEWIDHQRA